MTDLWDKWPPVFPADVFVGVSHLNEVGLFLQTALEEVPVRGALGVIGVQGPWVGSTHILRSNGVKPGLKRDLAAIIVIITKLLSTI